MTKIKNHFLTVVVLAVVVLFGAVGAYKLNATANASQSPEPKLGASVVGKFTSNTSYWVGKDIATKVATTSMNRTFLALSNLSGATSTAQAIYCGTSDTQAAYTGLAVQASTTMTFSAGQVPGQALYCRAAVSSSTMAVADF